MKRLYDIISTFEYQDQNVKVDAMHGLSEFIDATLYVKKKFSKANSIFTKFAKSFCDCPFRRRNVRNDFEDEKISCGELTKAWILCDVPKT